MRHSVGQRLAAMAVAVALSGCATIILGPSQKVSITSEPPGARATVLPEGINLVTPGEATLTRGHIHTVRFECEGYRTTMGYLDHDPNSVALLNFILGGLIGIMVDQANGSAYTLEPDPLRVVLPPAARTNPSTPRP